MSTAETGPNYRRRQRLAANASPRVPLRGDLFRHSFHNLKLITPQHYLREFSRVYRETRQGLIPIEDASRLAFILSKGGALAQVVTELRKLEALREELRLLRAQGDSYRLVASPVDESNGAPVPVTGELLPARDDADQT